jgi:hypothetical protein
MKSHFGPPPLPQAIRRPPVDRGHQGQEPPLVAPPAAPPTAADLRQRAFEELTRIADADAAWRRQKRVQFLLFALLPSSLTSVSVHMLLLIGLGACIASQTPLGARLISVVAGWGELEEAEESLRELAVEMPPEPLTPELAPAPLDAAEFLDYQAAADVDAQIARNLSEMLKHGGAMPGAIGAGAAADSGAGITAPTVGDSPLGLAGRTTRRQQALAYGATPESENAVDLALEWLARHQRRDGAWSLAHRTATHDGCLCGNPGSTGADNAATGMALLAFLGVGHTHLEGKYRERIAAGLAYLIAQQKSDGSLCDGYGRMYSHGLGTLALCEAWAMTEYRGPVAPARPSAPDPKLVVDLVAANLPLASVQRAPPAEPKPAEPPAAVGPRLDDPFDLSPSGGRPVRTSARKVAVKKPPVRPRAPASHPLRPAWAGDAKTLRDAAARAIAFVEFAQHSGGGWRYRPRELGDTSVVGWQMMALRSARLGGLSVHPETMSQAGRFLDSVSGDALGSYYGYMPGGGRADHPVEHPIGATTPIGLLCRIYSGWRRDEPGLQTGVQRLVRNAQPGKGMYFYYYATQVMHQYGGPQWSEWDRWMRTYLVTEQRRDGDETGSWTFNGSHDGAGRVYCTAMAAMTLEVYYRYSPIYRDQALQPSLAESQP